MTVRNVLLAAFALGLQAGCSLLVNFTPEAQTCGDAGQCQGDLRCKDQSCDDGDPCTLNDTCDGNGQCKGTSVTCNSPPNSSCYQAAGTCNPANGQCEYTPQTTNSPCDDGNPCTVNDACNGSGTCVSGPPMNCGGTECAPGSCQNGSCVYNAQLDGTKCGSTPGGRCCSGGCVDISNDPNHCGGCGINCSSGVCEPITATPECLYGSPPNPSYPTEAISGRCTCAASTAQCTAFGFDQVCRSSQWRYYDRCVPPSDGNPHPNACSRSGYPQTYRIWDDCPAFCEY